MLTLFKQSQRTLYNNDTYFSTVPVVHYWTSDTHYWTVSSCRVVMFSTFFSQSVKTKLELQMLMPHNPLQIRLYLHTTSDQNKTAVCETSSFGRYKGNANISTWNIFSPLSKITMMAGRNLDAFVCFAYRLVCGVSCCRPLTDTSSLFSETNEGKFTHVDRNKQYKLKGVNIANIMFDGGHHYT